MSEALAFQDYPPDLSVDQYMATVGEDEDVFVTNLLARHTGLPGVVFISSRVAAHGPRIKYFLVRGGENPSYSVSIGPEPRILASTVSTRDLNRTAPEVFEWVRLNHQELLRFWNEGAHLTPEELSTLVDSLRKV